MIPSMEACIVLFLVSANLLTRLRSIDMSWCRTMSDVGTCIVLLSYDNSWLARHVTLELRINSISTKLLVLLYNVQATKCPSAYYWLYLSPLYNSILPTQESWVLVSRFLLFGIRKLWCDPRHQLEFCSIDEMRAPCMDPTDRRGKAWQGFRILPTSRLTPPPSGPSGPYPIRIAGSQKSHRDSRTQIIRLVTTVWDQRAKIVQSTVVLR